MEINKDFERIFEHEFNDNPRVFTALKSFVKTQFPFYANIEENRQKLSFFKEKISEIKDFADLKTKTRLEYLLERM